MEGRIRQEVLSADILTSCAHCDRDIVISVNSELHYEGPPHVLVFEPRVDWSRFTEPNIIHHY